MAVQGEKSSGCGQKYPLNWADSDINNASPKEAGKKLMTMLETETMLSRFVTFWPFAVDSFL